MAYERVSSVLSQWHEELPGFRKQLSEIGGAIDEISVKTRKTGLTLNEIIDCYTQAERAAFDGHQGVYSNNHRAFALPKIRNSPGAVLFDRTILPDWLQIAVLNYERSQSE